MALGILISFITFGTVYVKTFQQDFTKENIEKASPFLIISAVILLLFGIIGSL